MSEKTRRPPQWRMKDDGTVWSEVGRPTENEVYLSGPLPCRGMRSVHREVLLRDYEEVRETRSPGGVAGVYVRLWDAVNAVVSASGGNAGSTSVARQVAVAAFDRVLADFAREYVLLAGNVSLREIADVERLYDKTRHRKFATEIAMLRQRVERRLHAIGTNRRSSLARTVSASEEVDEAYAAYHNLAMSMIDQAGRDSVGDALSYERMRKALDLETQAAESVPHGLEPTRSVLYRSASNIAFGLAMYEEATRLAVEGLRGDAPVEVKAELFDMIDRSAKKPRLDIVSFFDEKSKWSLETFGPGDRYAGVVKHIKKELKEIEENPSDLIEWVDVIFLAMDGAMRSAGADGAAIAEAMWSKHAKNTRREWPDWRTLQPGEVSQHIKTLDGDDS